MLLRVFMKRHLPTTILASLSVLAILGPAAQAASVTVATAGDIANADAPGIHQTRTADLITDVIDPAKVLALGDEQYEAGEYGQFLASYDPTWGAFKNITAPVPGNHEYNTPKAAGYFRYFGNVLQGYGTTANDPTRGYYSFDLGNWHIAALNSECDEVDCLAERAWLRRDLAADSHTCELAFYHRPATRGFARKMAAAGGELLLAGHRHKYERWDSVFGLDVRQFVVGTGGKSVGAPDPAADAGAKAFGVMKLRLTSSGYTWAFIDIDGRTLDSGSGACHN